MSSCSEEYVFYNENEDLARRERGKKEVRERRLKR